MTGDPPSGGVSPVEEMDWSNQKYGHRFALADYCVTNRRRPCRGRLLHGWTPHARLLQGGAPLDSPLFVWNQRNATQADRGLVPRTVPIGAPWLYLLGRRPMPSPAGRRLLVFPFHVGFQGREQRDRDVHTYAAEIQRLARDFSWITVCLYFNDYQDTDIRRSFESCADRVVTAGFPWSEIPEDESFLERLWRIIEAHDYVTTNRVATCLWYAISAGRPAFIYGSPVGLVHEPEHDGVWATRWVRQRYPRLLYERFDGACASASADVELGREFMRTPDELREALWWNGARKYAMDLCLATQRARNAVALVLGREQRGRNGVAEVVRSCKRLLRIRP